MRLIPIHIGNKHVDFFERGLKDEFIPYHEKRVDEEINTYFFDIDNMSNIQIAMLFCVVKFTGEKIGIALV